MKYLNFVKLKKKKIAKPFKVTWKLGIVPG